jgi:ribosomal protein L1
MTKKPKRSTAKIAALTALKALQEDAKRKGLDKMTMDEINAEIARHRREKRHQS